MDERHHDPSHELPGSADNPGTHHEESDVNIRGIFTFALLLLVSTVAVAVLMGLLFALFDRREEARTPAPRFPLAAGRPAEVPSPRLQAAPRDDLKLHRQREDEQLRSYGWEDRESGLVRIPIDEAMRLTLERGLPSRNAPEPGGQEPR